MKDPEFLNKNQKRIEKDHGSFIKKLKQHPPKGIDAFVKEADHEVFAVTNCLDCANCCKTISPVFKERDITRLSAHFRLRPSEFAEKYLLLDRDGDYVLKSVPCPFLESDKKCSVYDHRPSACRGYPHTGTLDFTKSTSLFVKNSAVCPAVYEITQKLLKAFNRK
jgi:uncharacterized protein